MLCVLKGTPKHEVKHMLGEMRTAMKVPVPERDVEIRFIQPMRMGIDKRLLQ
ncbi:MAG: hypothetical protein JWP58_3917 [Hymenobacter sp.]|nr:hypothetical protein [Hymenobacter sp.]